MLSQNVEEGGLVCFDDSFARALLYCCVSVREVCSARVKRNEGRYVLMSVLLGLSCIVVSLWEKFAQPEERGVRAGTF